MPRLTGPFPQSFGPFEVLGLLGEGGMAAVYHARDTRTRREVALKLPDPELLEAPDGRRRFREEARIGRLLSHPNCCQVLEYVEAGADEPVAEGAFAETWMVLPLLRGGSLEQRIQRGRPSVLESVVLTLKIANVLEFVHSRGLLHADLKPRNILFADDDEPILSDFGIALDLANPDVVLPPPGTLEGTLPCFAPEQVRRGPDEQIGPSCDVWALGLVLYELLSGVHPFGRRDQFPTRAATPEPWLAELLTRWLGPDASSWEVNSRPHPVIDLLVAIVTHHPPPPSQLQPGVPPELDRICRRAMAKTIQERYASAAEMGRDLQAFLEPRQPASTSVRTRISPDCIGINFVPYGTRAPEGLQETLYLDVGGDLRAGVIDHHQLHHYPGSTATMVAHRLELIDQALRPDRKPDDPFTLVLHENPDLDGLGSAWLARAWLTQGSLPAGTAGLCEYLDQVDAGHPGFSVRYPHTPYTGFLVLLRRSEAMELSREQRWTWAVMRGFEMLDHLPLSSARTADDVRALDAFSVPGLFSADDRKVIEEDYQRYRRKLADARTCTRTASLSLPVQVGRGRESVPALLVRHVQDSQDPDRCLFFKDWARTDHALAGGQTGFVTLVVFMDLGKTWNKGEQTGSLGRGIVSVTPSSGVSLRGLGKRLEEAERRRRIELFGADDRDFDANGQARPPRAGYRSPDPWYDGRAHNFTIIDSPACGSVLTADEIEQIVLEYGRAAGDPGPLGT